MLNEQIFKDVAELHARLIDHHPVLQGHINYFVKEFEEKRNNREIERLQKTSEAINEMNNRLIPESEDAMKTFLINVTAKLKVATEVCKKIVEKENSVDVEYIEEQRESRKERWAKFMELQNEKCDRIDHEFEDMVDRLKQHYEDLEDKLRHSNISTP